jgi:hypothetical protein
MAYSPIAPGTLIPGLVATDAAGWRAAVTNDLAVYSTYSPTIAAAALGAYTTSTTEITACEFQLPQNLDQHDVTLLLRWKVDGGTGTAEFAVTDGSGTDSATATTTATSYGWTTLTVTPSSSSGHPRTCRIRYKASGSGAGVYVAGVLAYLSPRAAGAGVLASGYARPGGEFYSTGAPIASERVERLCKNPIKVVEDRPAGLVCLLDDFAATSSRALMTTTTAAIVARWIMPAASTGYRSYRVAVYLDADGSAVPACEVYIGANVLTFSGSGWQQTTAELKPIPGKVETAILKVDSGTGNAFIRAIQIMRED